MTFPTESISEAGSGLVFVNTYDATVSASYRTAIVNAENYLQSQFSNAVTINASFSLGPLGVGEAAENSFSTIQVSYDAFKAALASHAVTADDARAVAGLPASDPSHGAGFSLAEPEAVILGLMSRASDSVDVTLNSQLAWSFGQDAVGAIIHELTEGGFGRLGSLGIATPQWAPMDLFRFTSAGVRDYTGGSDGALTYFGVDSSHVTGPAYHNSVDLSGTFDGADLSDWGFTRGDSFGPGGPNSPGTVSASDLQVLDVLGWTPTSAAAAAPSGELLSASQANPDVSGGTGGDTISGWAGGDVLRGNDGADSMVGGTGFNDINGNKGDDTIAGHSSIGDWLVGGQGNDLISTTTSGNILYGNLGNDTLHGGTGADLIRGGKGDDSIVAGSGSEWISGDRGSDTIQGGSGADTFHTSTGAGIDQVIGFNAAKGDHVQLDPGTTYTVSQSGADTIINMGPGDEMILKNVTLSTLPTGWIFGA